jgi:hypothetical protein
VTYISNITRPEKDPKVLSTGPSSLAAVDRLGRALGWFSIGLGLAELLAPRPITRALGVQGREDLVRAYGAREIGSGLLSLSLERKAGLWSRVAGDGLDIATLLSAYRPNNPKRDNVRLALLMVIGVSVLDIVGAQGTTIRHARRQDTWRNYRDRSGFPQGLTKARGVAASRSAEKPEKSAMA